VAHFQVISAERHERGFPLWFYGNFDTEARAVEVARDLVVSGGAGFAIVMPSDRRANPARLVHVFLDRRPRFDMPERERFESGQKAAQAAQANDRGLAHAERGQYDGAIADYTEAIRLNPQGAAAYNNRALAHEATGNHDLAITDFTEAIRLSPKRAEIYYNRGLSYSKTKDHEKAIADFTEAIWLNPKSARAYYDRGVCYAAKGNHDRAIADFN
jgi:tetratricopeptide (TPR) repeat protein